MKAKLVFKVITLILVLSVTVYAMFLLKSGHMDDFWTSLGFDRSGKKLNWCSNRLIRLESDAAINKTWALEENQNKWLLQIDAHTATEVDYLAVEKWLAKYCNLNINLYKEKDLLDHKLTPFAKATFNDGSRAIIYSESDELFQINEFVFKSEEMKSAIVELKGLLKI